MVKIRFCLTVSSMHVFCIAVIIDEGFYSDYMPDNSNVTCSENKASSGGVETQVGGCSAVS